VGTDRVERFHDAVSCAAPRVIVANLGPVRRYAGPPRQWRSGEPAAYASRRRRLGGT